MTADSAPTLSGSPTDTTDVERIIEECALIVLGWRECDWPEGFNRWTAEVMAEDRASRIRALKMRKWRQ